MFRFDNDGGADPSNTAEFETFSRSYVPNNDEVTDQIGPWGVLTDTEFRMSTGSFTGDGRQASHWKDNGITGELIGIMDPTLAYGSVVPISEADLRAFDLIGWEIAPIPEPSSGLLVLVGLMLGLLPRRRKA
jgi:hypothetical protein